MHIDQPYTAKTHQQRNGRSDRIGALHDTAYFYDLSHDAPFARRRQRLLETKYPVTETFQQPSELLDQDGSGNVQRISDERERRLASAVNDLFATAPVPEESEESQAARAEYATQEAAGQGGLF